MNSYHPEHYWNEVGKQILKRKNNFAIAGDDEPYYRYKRQKFLNRLCQINFQNLIVLEIGSGPGGNLKEVYKKSPKELHGVDISDEMISIAKQLLSGQDIEILKMNGEHIPYPSNYFDISFTSTVLQHVTDEKMLIALAKEIIRVSKSNIYLFERTEPRIKGNALNLGRPVQYYKELFGTSGFQLSKVEFINPAVSYFVCGGIRKLFNARGRNEGQPLSKTSKVLQKIVLPVTTALDPIVRSKRELTMLHFQRQENSCLT